MACLHHLRTWLQISGFRITRIANPECIAHWRQWNHRDPNLGLSERLPPLSYWGSWKQAAWYLPFSVLARGLYPAKKMCAHFGISPCSARAWWGTRVHSAALLACDCGGDWLKICIAPCSSEKRCFKRWLHVTRKKGLPPCPAPRPRHSSASAPPQCSGGGSLSCCYSICSALVVAPGWGGGKCPPGWHNAPGAGFEPFVS